MALTFCITGAGRGIGLELTQFALEAGHKVYALVRNPDSAPALRTVSKQYADNLIIIKADVTDASTLQACTEILGDNPLDILVHNAGIYTKNDGQFSKLTRDDLHITFQTNTFAPVLVTHSLLPHLLKSKQPKLVCITSLMGSIADNKSGGSYAYRMSKTALNMFIKSFSIDYPQIVSLTLHPGWVRTDMGGPQAPLLPRESARGLFKVITEATPNQTGHFYDYSGKELPW